MRNRRRVSRELGGQERIEDRSAELVAKRGLGRDRTLPDNVGLLPSLLRNWLGEQYQGRGAGASHIGGSAVSEALYYVHGELPDGTTDGVVATMGELADFVEAHGLTPNTDTAPGVVLAHVMATQHEVDPFDPATRARWGAIIDSVR